MTQHHPRLVTRENVTLEDFPEVLMVWRARSLPDPSVLVEVRAQVRRRRTQHCCVFMWAPSNPGRARDHAGNGCDDHHQSKGSAERIDSSNQLVTGPYQQGQIGKHADEALDFSFRVVEMQHSREENEDEEGDVRPLDHRQASSPTIYEHPADRAADNTLSRGGGPGRLRRVSCMVQVRRPHWGER
jgi:hypothetical protein